MLRAKEELRPVIAVNQPHKPAQSVSPGLLHVFPRGEKLKGRIAYSGKFLFSFFRTGHLRKEIFSVTHASPTLRETTAPIFSFVLVRLVGEKNQFNVVR